MGTKSEGIKSKPSQFLLLMMLVVTSPAELRTSLSQKTTVEEQQDGANRQFLQALRFKALHNLQRSLESLSSLTADSLMLNAALQSSEESSDDWELEEEKEAILADQRQMGDQEEVIGQQQDNSLLRTRTASSGINSDFQHHFHTSHSRQSTTSLAIASDEQAPIMSLGKQHGVRRIRADLKEMPKEPGEMTTRTTASRMEGPNNNIPTRIQHRKMRSTRHGNNGHNHGGHHRRRRKGCPTVHGKDQLLCPTRNTHRYDVCITREQLCDRVRDCPGGEDEDSRHCFFYRPLESSLKTVSHAVLLLVDTMMREQEEQQKGNEL